MANTCMYTYLYLYLSVVLFFFDGPAFGRDDKQFIYNGFQEAHLHLDGFADIHSNGLLQMTNTSQFQESHVFYPQTLNFKATPSFSTTFVFAINPYFPDQGDHGIAFVISPSINFRDALTAEYLGLFNVSNNGLASNHVFAVELDTLQTAIFNDIDSNHVGIDVNGLTSVASAPAAYYSDEKGIQRSLDLISKRPMQVWIDYDADVMLVNVTLAPLGHVKPSKHLLSTHVNLSAILFDSMYVGFSSSTGIAANEHYILGWSWNQSGRAQGLDPSRLPSLPRFHKPGGRPKSVFLVILVLLLFLVVAITGAAYMRRRKMYEELQETWEQEYASHRFSYKDLYVATKGFNDSELLGSGGFGKVYKGVLPSIQTQVAVKRVSHDSRQGMREFVSEIVSMKRLRHRNLTQLLGYCRMKQELLLVYDYMPNGSLDKFRFKDNKPCISWSQRLCIIKGVASGLLYLHEEGEKVVLHRDVKASNVLLDAAMNARLSDFGLARLYDHGSNPRSTCVVGTLGYLAPELSITGKPTTATDVFAFGIFLLVVACGRRPIDFQDLDSEDFLLVDWVFDCWKKGAILETSDPRLEGNYACEEMELVLKLGLMCSHHKAEVRPSMRHIVQLLRGDATLPDMPSEYDHERSGFSGKSWGLSPSYPLVSFSVSRGTLSTDSVIHYGR